VFNGKFLNFATTNQFSKTAAAIWILGDDEEYQHPKTETRKQNTEGYCHPWAMGHGYQRQ
jgi:hypothetical protein